MNTADIIREIKSELRLSMNGVASTAMRESGITYRVNFGVELPRLETIAAQYEKNPKLAQNLWNENVRECKILATLLQPVETFLPEIADIWIEEMPTVEIAQITVRYLFKYMTKASEKAFQWMASDKPMFQVCGFLLLAHLLMEGNIMLERSETEFLDQAENAIHSSDANVRKAATSALLKFSDINPNKSHLVEPILQEL